MARPLVRSHWQRLTTPDDAPTLPSRGRYKVTALAPPLNVGLMDSVDLPCALCGSRAPLHLSHILPAFVIRWLRESAGGNPIRNSQDPNRRVQDGEKRYLLCSECEQRFSKWEKRFADHVFYPYLKDEAGTYPYGPWLLQFCVSVSWRVLKLSLEESNLHEWQPGVLDAAQLAEERWRSFLLGNVPHPGPFEQHLIPFSQILPSGQGEPSNINRYLTRAVQIDLCQGTSVAFTFAKLGRFGICGFIVAPTSNRWVGTKVNANEGRISPRAYRLPAGLWRYLIAKAKDVRAALASVSPVQHKKIEENLLRNQNRFVGSDAFKAMQADIDQFGSAAFIKRDNDPNNSI